MPIPQNALHLTILAAGASSEELAAMVENVARQILDGSTAAAITDPRGERVGFYKIQPAK